MKTRQELYNSRPTSPHLTIYKKQISSVLSIFHRLSGIALFFGLAIVMWWFVLLVFSRFDPYYVQMAKCGVVRLGLVAISFAWIFHFCTGVRHLVWATGHWFSVPAVNLSGWIALIGSVLFTLIFWVYIVG